jgi:signal peptidase II
MVPSESQTMKTPAATMSLLSAVDGRLLYAIPVVGLAVDQVLKLIVVWWLGPDADSHRWELAGRLVAFEYVENRGAAFGILPGQTMLLTAVALIIVAGCMVLMRREAKTHPVAAMGIGLIVGGALGNMTDRVRLGYVVDFIAIGIWPKFHLADTMITIGIGLLLWSGVRETPARHPGDTTANEEQHTDEQSTITA